MDSVSSNLVLSVFFIKFGPIVYEMLMITKEETLLQKKYFLEVWEFLNIDLDLTSCVLNSQNGKRERERERARESEREREIDREP